MAGRMAHSAVHWTLEGNCFGGTEIWQTGFWTGNDASDLPGTQVPQATVDAVATAWQTFFTSTNGNIASIYKATDVKAAYFHSDFGDSNISEYGTPTVHTYTTPLSGAGIISAAYPPQITACVSLTSGYHTGTAARGRMFLPGVNCTLDNSTGRMVSTYRNQVATAMQTFINAVNTATVPGSAGKMILVGRAADTALPPHESKNAYVTGLKVGDIFDTQRRRRNGIRESYYGLPVA
jgi:hypothetical protein